MPKMHVFILGDRLVPVSEADRQRWSRLPRGPELVADIKKERSLPQHRMVRKLIALVAEAMREGPDGMAEMDDETVLTDLMCATGYAQVRDMTEFERQIYGANPGSKIAHRRSTAFDNMDMSEYGRFADRAAAFLMNVHVPWLAECVAGREAINILIKMGANPDGAMFRGD